MAGADHFSTRIDKRSNPERIEIAPIESERIFSALQGPDGSKYELTINGGSLSGDNLHRFYAPNRLHSGGALELGFPLAHEFSTHSPEAMSRELNSRLNRSCGEHLDASVGESSIGSPAVIIGRRAEVEGFQIEEGVAEFRYKPGGWVEFRFRPEVSRITSAGAFGDEAKLALAVLKDFIDAHYHLSNEQPPREGLSMTLDG